MDPASSVAIINNAKDFEFNFYFDTDTLKNQYEESLKKIQSIDMISDENSENNSDNININNSEPTYIEKKVKEYILYQLGKFYNPFSHLNLQNIVFKLNRFNHSKQTISDNDLSDFVKSVNKNSSFTAPTFEINIFVLEKITFHNNGDKVLGRSKLYQNSMFLFEAVLQNHRNAQNLNLSEDYKQALFFLLPSIQTILHEFGHLIGTLSCSEEASSDKEFHCTTNNCLMNKSNNGMGANNLYSNLIDNILSSDFSKIESHFCKHCQSCLLKKVLAQ